MSLKVVWLPKMTHWNRQQVSNHFPHFPTLHKFNFAPEMQPELRFKPGPVYDIELSLEIAHFLASMLQSWGIDPHLDQCCQKMLGMRHPKRPASFGLVSKEGHLSICLPGMDGTFNFATKKWFLLYIEPHVKVGEEKWKKSRALTTQHLLALVSLADAGLSADGLSFNEKYEKTKRVLKCRTGFYAFFYFFLTKYLPDDFLPVNNPYGLCNYNHQRHRWSRQRSRNHLNSRLNRLQSSVPNSCRLSKLGTRWPPFIVWCWPTGSSHVTSTDRHWSSCWPGAGATGVPRFLVSFWFQYVIWFCFSKNAGFKIRDAAQTLLLRELNRIGPEGRKELLDKWSQYLPTTVDSSVSILAADHGLHGQVAHADETSSATLGKIDILYVSHLKSADYIDWNLFGCIFHRQNQRGRRSWCPNHAPQPGNRRHTFGRGWCRVWSGTDLQLNRPLQ